jgi:hypothetical protein
LLQLAGIEVVRHADHFDDDTPDEEWIAEVAKRGWIAISHDKRISRRPNERAAVMNAHLALIVVVGGVPTALLAQNFVSTLPVIERFLGRHDPPFVARLYRPTPTDLKRKRRPVGRIELWLDN